MAVSSSITVHRSGGALVVRLRGEVDVLLAQEAERVAARVAAERLPVVLDLAGVELLGATGLALLTRCRDACEDAGVGCSVRDVPESVARLLTVLGLDAVLPPVTSTQSAVAARTG